MAACMQQYCCLNFLPSISIVSAANSRIGTGIVQGYYGVTTAIHLVYIAVVWCYHYLKSEQAISKQKYLNGMQE